MRTLRHAVPWLSLLASGLCQENDYRFVVDGREADPRVISLAGTPDSPAPGDLVQIGSLWLRLDEPGEYLLTDRWQQDRQVHRDVDGADVVVAVAASGLLELDDAGLRLLRGVRLEAWNEAIAAAVGKLAPDVPLVLTEGATLGDARTIPDLPPALRHLAMSWESGSAFDLRPARALAALTSLSLAGPCNDATRGLDLAVFAGATRLRHLTVEHGNVSGGEVIAAFRELREFSSGSGRTALGWLDLEWFANARELRRLAVQGCKAPSLGPLAHLPQLRSLTAAFSAAPMQLPSNGFVALKYLNLQGTDVASAELRAFAAEHRACRITVPAEPKQLQEALRMADRVLVRTGGTCHRIVHTEKVLFDSKDPGAVQRAASLVVVIPDEHMHHCMCCGDPTVEFFVGDRSVAMLGIHHGRSLRWANGPWTSDARLDREAGGRLAAWLADLGATGPKDELEEIEARSAAQRARALARSALLGTTIDKETTDEAPPKWLRVLESPDGAQLALRLLGCHEGAWNERDAFDEAVVVRLANPLAETTWVKWIELARTDTQLANGLASAFADDAVRPRLGPPALGMVARAGLTHPQPWNRARTLQLLRDDPTDASLALLRDALRGAFVPREVTTAALVSPTGTVMVFPSDPVLDALRATVPALAARCLATRRDTVSLPKIRELAATATDADAAVLAESVRALEGG